MSRILLAAPNWLGDAVLVTPLLQAIRRHEPSAHVAVLAVPRVAELLRGHPDVSDIILFDERGRDRSVLARRRLAQRLRRERFDLALFARPSRSRAWLCWLAGIRRRIGHAHAGKSWWLTDRVVLPSPTLHRAEQYLQLVTALGWPVPTDLRCRIPVRDADRALVRQWLHAQGIMNDATVILLHPAGNWAHKRWPAERFAALGDRLHEAHTARILITGAEGDRAAADAVGTAMRSDAIVAAGELTVGQLVALLERADLLVVNDSGPLHMAAALERPFVALFGPTSPEVTGPYHATRGRVVHHPEGCPAVPCYRAEDPPHAGMQAIEVEEVYDAARQQLCLSRDGSRHHAETPHVTQGSSP